MQVPGCRSLRKIAIERFGRRCPKQLGANLERFWRDLLLQDTGPFLDGFQANARYQEFRYCTDKRGLRYFLESGVTVRVQRDYAS